MFKAIKNFIRKNLTLQTPNTLFSKKESGYSNNNFSKIMSYGSLNKDKTFYVIKRTPGTGLFSNVVFVLNHLIIAKKYKFIPIIDMENFKTIYNERKKIYCTYNAWNYFFEKISLYNLNEVYKSNKVIIVCDTFFSHFEYDMESSKFKNLILDNVKIKKKFLNISKKFIKRNFGKKTLGIHFRGTSYKQSAGHPMPATPKQMVNLVRKIIKRDNIDKIFLSTEEKNYLKIFQKEFPHKVSFIKSAYRSNKNDAFKIYNRLNHRYKLGREILIETILLSHCDSFIYLNSNVSSASIAFNFNVNQNRYIIKNGMNSKNIIIAMFYWYFKKFLPKKFGGFH